MDASTRVDPKLERLAEEVGALRKVARRAEDSQQMIRTFIHGNRELIEAAIAGVAALSDIERDALHRSHSDLSLPGGSDPYLVDHFFKPGGALEPGGLMGGVADDDLNVLRRVVGYAKYVVDTTGLPEVAGVEPAVAPRAVRSPMTSKGVEGIVFRTTASQGSPQEAAPRLVQSRLGPDQPEPGDPFLFADAYVILAGGTGSTTSLWVPLRLESVAQGLIEEAGFEVTLVQSTKSSGTS